MWEPRLTSWRATSFPTPIPAHRRHSRALLNSVRPAFRSAASALKAKLHRLHTRATKLSRFPLRVRRLTAALPCKQAIRGRNRLTIQALWLERQRRVPSARSLRRRLKIPSILIQSGVPLRSTQRTPSLLALHRRFRFKHFPFWAGETEKSKR